MKSVGKAGHSALGNDVELVDLSGSGEYNNNFISTSISIHICLILDEDEKSPNKRGDGSGHSGPGNDLPDVSIDHSDSGKSITLKLIYRLSS